MASVVDPISPELALVSPELAERARAELPDRPWEAFLPAVPVAVLRLPGPVEVALPESTLAPTVVPQRAPRRRRPRVPVGAVVLAAFAALLVAGSVLPMRDPPTFAPLSAQASGPEPSGPASRVPPAATTPPVGSSAPPVETHDPRSLPTTLTQTARTAPKTALRRARPSGGYIFRGGYLRVDEKGRTIVELQATSTCVGRVVVRGVEIRSDGRFTVRRVIVGRSATVKLKLAGAFVSTRTVRGTIRVSAAGCRSRAIRFTGRLS